MPVLAKFNFYDFFFFIFQKENDLLTFFLLEINPYVGKY